MSHYGVFTARNIYIMQTITTILSVVSNAGNNMNLKIITWKTNASQPSVLCTESDHITTNYEECPTYKSLLKWRKTNLPNHLIPSKNYSPYLLTFVHYRLNILMLSLQRSTILYYCIIILTIYCYRNFFLIFL